MFEFRSCVTRVCWVLTLLVAWTGQGHLCAAEKLADKLQPLIDDFAGEVAVMVKHLDTGETFAHRADEPFPTASLIKLPIMIAAYDVAEGTFPLTLKVTLRDDDKVPGSGILTTHFSEGATISLRDAIQLMIAFSDNTATNLVIDAIGIETTNKLMESLGCTHTRLHSKVYRGDTSIDRERSKRFGLGSTSCKDMLALVGKLHAKELVTPAACEQMLAHLKDCDDKLKSPRLLPPGTTVFHKTGSVNSSRTDAGIIMSPAGPIGFCVLTDKLEDRSWGSENAGDMLCSKIAKEAYDHFNQDQTVVKDSPPVLKIGATGLIVESLQRTLNKKLAPRPAIGVDGDFGGQTEEAVKEFQRRHKLPESGEVGRETWQALGPLVAEEEVPDPSVINAEVVKKQPREDLAGPPATTCKAWAIGDGQTGKLLWGLNDSELRDIASTTKIMTAYLVTTLAEAHPEILDEVIVFSERADKTTGSTAGVRAGEKISVRELLYGLLLPSGNDASVALAEHFGSRLAKSDEADAPPYDCFIIAMNNMAEELGMKKTTYKNPHGLPAEGHQSTAGDLLKLAHAAMQQPLLRDYVATYQRGCTVEGPGGYRRNIVWKNTNRLLGTEGYEGIKTGTTNAAGACLVSQGTRDGRSVIVVVLGASSSEGRYVDSRNLYRWAWQQLDLGKVAAK